MVKIKIHRGTDQIGGTVTEVYTENTHIFVDFGSELSTEPENSTDEKMIAMMKNSECDAVLFTHYHGDHIGLMPYIPKENKRGTSIKLYMGAASRRILLNIYDTLSDNQQASEEERQDYQIMQAILQDEKRCLTFEKDKPFSIGDFTITPIRVDHSAYDAYMFVIEAEGKCIVHTGDYRTHGRLGKDFYEKLEKKMAGKNVDVLLTEGTMMGRLGEKVRTEEEMQQEALELLKKPENKYAFLVCSSTNVESLASFHNAAMELERAFYVNSYVHKQLMLYRATAGKEDFDLNFWKAYKFEPLHKYNPKLGMTQQQFMEKNGFVMLVGPTEAYKRRMEPFRQYDPLLIYSMWEGYIEKGEDTYDEKLGKLCDSWRFKPLHTSGHAVAEDIEKMILTVKPQKAIIPIHTEYKKRFEKLAIGELVKKIKVLDDNATFYL